MCQVKHVKFELFWSQNRKLDVCQNYSASGSVASVGLEQQNYLLFRIIKLTVDVQQSDNMSTINIHL